MKNKKSILSQPLYIIMCLVLLFVAIDCVNAASVGQTLSNVKIRNANDNPVWIPDFGKKVLSIFYADPEGADLNDPLADAIKAKKFPKSKYRGIGIANLKDTWKPNSLIRMMVRRKIAKYNSTILTDPNRIVPGKWGLGNCDDTSVVIIIGKDKKVKFIKKGKVRGSGIVKVLNLIASEIKK